MSKRDSFFINASCTNFRNFRPPHGRSCPKETHSLCGRFAAEKPKKVQNVFIFWFLIINSTSSLNQLNQPADLSVSNTDFLKSTQLEGGGGSELAISYIDQAVALGFILLLLKKHTLHKLIISSVVNTIYRNCCPN